MSTDATVMRSPFSHVCQQHVDETAHLWGIWSSALHLPHYDRAALRELELRVQANIAGMRVYGNEAWRICHSTLDIADNGELFAAAQIAFRSYDSERIRMVVETVEQERHLEPGLISALAWLPGDIAHPWLKKLLQSKQLLHKALALEVCRQRGEDPAAYLTRLLQREDCQADHDFICVALRCAGEFKRGDLQQTIAQQLNKQGEARFWALYASVLVGQTQLAEQLRDYVFAGPCQSAAIHLAFRVLGEEVARQWMREMVAQDVGKQYVIQAAQALGDPLVIPWLVGVMREQPHARLAGHAFFSITGIDLEQNGWVTADPESLEDKLAREEADENAEMPIEEHLPWPDVDKIWRAWTGELSARFIAGRRHLLGLAITEPNLKAAIASGYQPQRHAAAIELALLKPAIPVVNTFGCVAPER